MPSPAWCKDFLRFQIATMKPLAVVTIGADARCFLARLTPDLSAWSSAPSPTVHEADIESHRVAAVALAHPSMYPASARHRSFGGEHGIAADAALLRAAAAGYRHR